MNQLIIIVKRFWLVIAGAVFALVLIAFELSINHKTNKYIIYAAERRYETNEFNVSGNTIYFKDARSKHNVCINGQYTLIYETVPEKP